MGYSVQFAKKMSIAKILNFNTIIFSKFISAKLYEDIHIHMGMHLVTLMIGLY